MKSKRTAKPALKTKRKVAARKVARSSGAAKPSRESAGVAHTLQAWATAMGVERRTLEARLVTTGWEHRQKGEKIPFRRIYISIMGDEQAEKNRNLTLDANRKEREEREAADELVNRDLMEKQIAEFYTLPITQALTSLPATLDTQCNPSDPELARAALLRWVEETKKLIREKMV